jgi:hypothetical protein
MLTLCSHTARDPDHTDVMDAEVYISVSYYFDLSNY